MLLPWKNSSTWGCAILWASLVYGPAPHSRYRTTSGTPVPIFYNRLWCSSNSAAEPNFFGRLRALLVSTGSTSISAPAVIVNKPRKLYWWLLEVKIRKVLGSGSSNTGFSRLTWLLYAPYLYWWGQSGSWQHWFLMSHLASVYTRWACTVGASLAAGCADRWPRTRWWPRHAACRPPPRSPRGQKVRHTTSR